MVKKFTRKQKSEIAGSWGMKVSEVDWDFVGKIKRKINKKRRAFKRNIKKKK